MKTKNLYILTGVRDVRILLNNSSGQGSFDARCFNKAVDAVVRKSYL
jgi:hypothetical protein